MSGFFSFFQPLFPKPIVDDMFMSVIIGSALSSYGIGMAINWGGNTGGVDIIADDIVKRRLSRFLVLIYPARDMAVRGSLLH